MPIDLAVVQKIIEEVAATEIMPRFRRLEKHHIEMKAIDDPVTVADKAAEEALVSRLRDILIGSVVVGEESCARDPGILDHFSSKDSVWVIDPIDGTWNFIQGRREFGVMVALVRHKKTIAAWIHDPNTGHTLMGERGAGVWLSGKRMRLAGRDPKLPKLVIIGSRLRDALSRPEVAKVVAGLPALAIGSAAAFDYARLFTGDLHFANSEAPRASSLMYKILKPWDHVPGVFLQSEADGYSANFFGNPYDMCDAESGLLLASDEEEWRRLYDTVKPALPSLAVACA